MTTWHLVSVIGWVLWPWSVRYLIHGRRCHCEICNDCKKAIGMTVGVLTLSALLLAGFKLVSSSPLFAGIDVLLVLLFVVENEEGFISRTTLPGLIYVRLVLYPRN